MVLTTQIIKKNYWWVSSNPIKLQNCLASLLGKKTTVSKILVSCFLLKQLITILIAASLYAPTVAKFFVYTACMVTVYTDSVSNTSWCNCSIETNNKQTETDWQLQKQLVEKNNWQYLLTQLYSPNYNLQLLATKNFTSHYTFCQQQYMQQLLKPPICINNRFV